LTPRFVMVPLRRLHARLAWHACAAATVLVMGCGSALAADMLLWFADGRPGPQAEQALTLLGAAASHGLEPLDYGAGALRQAVERAATGAPLPPAAAAQLDGALTAATQRYLADLHRGRIDPRQLHPRVAAPPRAGFDAAAALRAALASQRLPEVAQDLAPRLPLYEHLRAALARYRAIGDAAAWRQPLPPLPVQRGRPARLEPGQPYAGAALLAQRLVALGDLAPDAQVPSNYEGPLVDAVMAFQQRHGLAADGVIGKATLAALQVTPSARVRQVELTLERLRWTPLLQSRRVIVVNIPEFVLRAYEVNDGRISVQQEMKVIVGRAYDQRTPLLGEDIRFIEFSPYWNVPPSIARAELVPRLRRDPAHLDREGFEFVGPGGRVETTLSAARLDAVLAGTWRIRQRPGPRNALGDIKFVFPNRDNIYLHHTPSTQLFERDRRDLSHGCIRVEAPVELARFVLQGMPAWTEERIREAMSRGTSATLRVAEPVPVVITYGTVIVKDGRIHFYQDIYGDDRQLDAALRRLSRERAAAQEKP
jgi:murein L,D-transpeptidase YcbB/YkuD